MTTPEKGYSASDIVAITEAEPAHVKHWAKLGIVTPDIEDTAGTGYGRRWSSANAVNFQVLATIRNEHRVTVDVLRGVSNTFQWFHRGAVALVEQRSKALLTNDRELGQVFNDVDHRRRVAAGFLRSGSFAPGDTETPIKLAEAWAALRSSSLSSGQPDPSWPYFIGLFFNSQSAIVALNPPDLNKVVEGTAIVVDLSEMVFQVARKCATRGYRPLGQW